jgi:hypothetical protein
MSWRAMRSETCAIRNSPPASSSPSSRLIVVDHAALALAGGGQQHLLDDLLQRVGLGLDRAGQRVAAQGAEAHLLHHRHLAGLQRHALVVDHDQRAVALDHRPLGGEVQRHDGDVLAVDVLPDVQLGPVADREHADRLALVLACGRCTGSTAPAAGSSGPSGAGRAEARRCAPWRGSSPRRAARRRRRRRSRACPAPASGPGSSITSVCTCEPWSKGLMPCADASGLGVHQQVHAQARAAMRSRNSYISRNFQVVSTCSSGKGGGAG